MYVFAVDAVRTGVNCLLMGLSMSGTAWSKTDTTFINEVSKTSCKGDNTMQDSLPTAINDTSETDGSENPANSSNLSGEQRSTMRHRYNAENADNFFDWAQ